MQNTWIGRFLEEKPQRYFETIYTPSIKPTSKKIKVKPKTITFRVTLDGITQILTSFS